MVSGTEPATTPQLKCFEPKGNSIDEECKSNASDALSTVPMSEVIVIGAGFAGIEVAKALGKAGVDATVVDRHNHHLFQPLLYQVATAALPPSNVAEPIRKILRKYHSVRVLLGEVTTIDTDMKLIRISNGTLLRYRFLVLACGAGHSYFGHNEWEKWAPGLKTIEDARHIRSELLMAFERAEGTTDPVERARLMSIAIIGGGSTGVELAGSIAELARFTLARDFRLINSANAHISLFEAGPRLLSTFSERSSAYAQKRLERLGVHVRTGCPVEDLDASSITINGKAERVGLMIWAAGVAASPLARQVSETDKSGRVAVTRQLQVVGVPGVYALGDLAIFNDTSGNALPGLAQVAKQQGLHLGRGLAEMIRKETPISPFEYKGRGNTSIVGRHAAIYETERRRFLGTAAWFFWAIIHIYLLNGSENRAMVSLQWLWRYLTYQRGARLISERDKTQGDTNRN